VAPPTAAQLAQLFGGPGTDDPTLMKQSIQIIEDPTIEDLEVKLTALENYEMLIENLDNANNIGNMKQWESIIKQLDSEEEDFKNLAASIIGIAVQNNDVSQKAFLEHADLAFPKLINLSKEEKNVKALFALSNVVRNNDDALIQFEKHNGWDLLQPVLDESSDKLKLKLFSLLSSLLTLEDKVNVLARIKTHNVVDQILNSINSETNVNLVDRSLFLLVSLVNHGYQFNDQEVAKIHDVVSIIESHFKDVINVDDYQVLKQVSSN
jgi:hypothetical protein